MGNEAGNGTFKNEIATTVVTKLDKVSFDRFSFLTYLDSLEGDAIYWAKYWSLNIFSCRHLCCLTNFECKYRILIENNVTTPIFCPVLSLRF